jgi:hypothetical protein
MPFLFHVDESSKVFHLEGTGEVNDADLMDLSSRIRQEVAFVSQYPIFCDCSAVTAVRISSSLIEALARAAMSRSNLVAIVAPCAAVFGLARMYQIISDPEITRIRVFTRAEDAKAWLSSPVEGPAVRG